MVTYHYAILGTRDGFTKKVTLEKEPSYVYTSAMHANQYQGGFTAIKEPSEESIKLVDFRLMRKIVYYVYEEI